MSEEKKTSEAILLRHIIDQIPDVLIIKDHEGNFLLCNQTVADLYNTTPEEMIGKHDDDYGVPDEMSEHFRKSALQIMASGETEIVFEDSIEAHTGKKRHFKSIKKPIKGPDGKDQIIILAQDITDIMEEQKRVKENETRLSTVMKIINEGVWDWHIPSGEVIHNTEWYKQLGSSPDTPGSLDNFIKSVHPDDLPDVRRTLDKLLSGETETYHSEHRMIKDDGSIIHVKDRGVIAERDEEDNPVRVMGSFKNITHEKMAQKELLEAKNKAEEASEAKSVFLSNISHEFRTPLNVILGFANMLKINNEKKLSQKQIEWADQILNSGNLLLELVNEVLDLAVIETGKSEYNAEIFRLCDVFEDCHALVQPIAKSRNIDVDIKCVSEQSVHVDKRKLKQCLINLMENAIKYNEPGGKVEIGCYNHGETELALSVKDNGLGISAKEQSMIFEPFYRGSEYSCHVDGTGIGLSLVKKIVDMMEGRISVESTLGEGTTFKIILKTIS